MRGTRVGWRSSVPVLRFTSFPRPDRIETLSTPVDGYPFRPRGASPSRKPLIGFAKHQGWTMRAHDDPEIENPDVLLAALERTNEAVVIVDGNLSVCYFNAAAERIWNMDRSD